MGVDLKSKAIYTSHALRTSQRATQSRPLHLRNLLEFVLAGQLRNFTGL